MTALNDFRSTVVRWLCDNGFSNVDIDIDYEFSYSFDDYYNGINIGAEACDEETGRNFQQFLYEYGLKYVNISVPVLSFFHELGHHMTLPAFNQEELWLFNFAKSWDHNGTIYEESYRYWLMADEFAANMWLINYINNNIETVISFAEMMAEAWEKLCQKVNPFDIIQKEEKEYVY